MGEGERTCVLDVRSKGEEADAALLVASAVQVVRCGNGSSG